MKARKADERYDAKMAYDKNLSGKARLHYLENDIADKGMSMKSPMDMGHKAPAKMKSAMEMGHEAPSMKAPMKKASKMSPADMKAPMKKESVKQEKKNLMKDNPVVKDASGKRKMTKEDFKKLGMKEAGERPKDARRYGKGFKKA
jgi:hypothetical protein|tara:strand:+ start:183 stop:617 length:435 start_codon:yes stop_codon:yes gene_type:complete